MTNHPEHCVIRSDARDLLVRLKTESAKPLHDRDEILHHLRGLRESDHRYLAAGSILLDPIRFKYDGNEYKPLMWRGPIDRDRLKRMVWCYNKSVMIYVLDPKGQPHDFGDGMLSFLDIWLYRQSFEPYESQTEFGCHIARTSTVTWKKGCSKPTIKEIHRWHKGLCDDLRDGKVMGDLPPELLDFQLKGYLGKQHGPLSTKGDILDAFRQTHILQPTFQSLFIVLDQATRPDEGPFKTNGIGNIPVYLVNTKCTQHPEHANSICQIRTTLKVAIQFVMGRSAVMNKYPRALLLGGQVDIEEEAIKVGWDDSKHGTLPLHRPSSTWVDRNRFTEWTGRGAVMHAQTVVLALRSLNSTKLKIPLEHCWWWWEGPLPTRRLRMLPHPHL